MRDRLPQPGKEGRVKITQDNGQVIEGVLDFADDATQAGSAYNRPNVLPDTVCDALGIDREGAEPKDAFAALLAIATSRYVVGQYAGTGTYGSSDPKILNFGFKPSLLMIQAVTGTGYGEDRAFAVADVLRVRTSESGNGGCCIFTWTSTGVSFYSDAPNNAFTQLNQRGKTYKYIAFK